MKLLTKTNRNKRRFGFSIEEVVVASSIIALTVTGTISGYLMVAKRTDWSARAAAADAVLMQRIEQIRAARWDTLASKPVDEVVAANFPKSKIALDVPQTKAAPVEATMTTTITEVSANPPVKMVKVECVWSSLEGRAFTNAIATYRSPDQ